MRGHMFITGRPANVPFCAWGFRLSTASQWYRRRTAIDKRTSQPDDDPATIVRKGRQARWNNHRHPGRSAKLLTLSTALTFTGRLSVFRSTVGAGRGRSEPAPRSMTRHNPLVRQSPIHHVEGSQKTHLQRCKVR